MGGSKQFTLHPLADLFIPAPTRLLSVIRCIGCMAPTEWPPMAGGCNLSHGDCCLIGDDPDITPSLHLVTKQREQHHAPTAHWSLVYRDWDVSVLGLTVEACTSRALPDFNICNSTTTFTQIEEDASKKARHQSESH